jgi:AcrR family transcriptional regulator
VVSTRDFLEAGLQVLANEGESKIKIDHLCAIQGVTKGSFYYHFADMADYRRSLMNHYEVEFTTRYIDKVESEGDRSGRHKLAALAASVLADDDRELRLEAAIRGWALRDRDVRAALERVDAVRCDYLCTLCRTEIDDPGRALEVARILYFIHIGGRHVVPPGSAQEMQAIWARALQQFFGPDRSAR